MSVAFLPPDGSVPPPPPFGTDRGTAVPVSCSPHPGGGVRLDWCIVGLIRQERGCVGLRAPLKEKAVRAAGRDQGSEMSGLWNASNQLLESYAFQFVQRTRPPMKEFLFFEETQDGIF